MVILVIENNYFILLYIEYIIIDNSILPKWNAHILKYDPLDQLIRKGYGTHYIACTLYGIII